jgi:hypothetical protein
MCRSKLRRNSSLEIRRRHVADVRAAEVTVSLGSWLCENEIGFGRNAQLKTNFSVFFALRITTEPKIPGAIIPRRVFTQPGSIIDGWSLSNLLRGLVSATSGTERLFAHVGPLDMRVGGLPMPSDGLTSRVPDMPQF